MGKATVLSKFHQLANPLRRFIRIDLDASLQTRTAALNGSRLDGAFAKETGGLLNASLPETDLCCFPGPGKLGEQSESNTGAEVGQRWWRTVVAADPLSLVSQYSEAAPRRSPRSLIPYLSPLLLTTECPGTHMDANVAIHRSVRGCGRRGWTGRSLLYFFYDVFHVGFLLLS